MLVNGFRLVIGLGLVYLVLALEAGYHVVTEDVGPRLRVKTGEERCGGDDAHVAVVEALVGTKGVETADGSAIDQAGRDVVELDQAVNTGGLLALVSSRSSEGSASGERGEESSESLHDGDDSRVERNERWSKERV